MYELGMCTSQGRLLLWLGYVVNTGTSLYVHLLLVVTTICFTTIF
jgi:hypothetical protein